MILKSSFIIVEAYTEKRKYFFWMIYDTTSQASYSTDKKYILRMKYTTVFSTSRISINLLHNADHTYIQTTNSGDI